MRDSRAFTLVELLLAIAIMGVLASLVIVAINPGKQMGDARNTQRKFDVNTILNAFGQYSIDSSGVFQPQVVDGSPLNPNCLVTTTYKNLCKETTTPLQCASATCVFSRHLSGSYIASIPVDPQDDESDANAMLMVDYIVRSTAPGRFEVVSPNAENDQSISASR